MTNIDLDNAEPYLLTQEGMDKLKDELNHLTTVKRAEIAERIRDSKDHGEFSEDNNELDEVKQEQAIVENRISELKDVLSNSEVLDPKKLSTKEVSLGSKVTVQGDGGAPFTVRIVSSYEADPDRDFIDEESPMGEALIGHKVGDKVTFLAPAGKVKYEITKIGK